MLASGNTCHRSISQNIGISYIEVGIGIGSTERRHHHQYISDALSMEISHTVKYSKYQHQLHKMSANTLASTSGNIYLQHTTNGIFPVADNFKSPTSQCRTSMLHNPPTLACPHSIPELPANITDRVNSIAYPVPYSIARGQPHGAPRARCIDTLYSFYTLNI